jgi:SPP1 family phage portal protein
MYPMTPTETEALAAKMAEDSVKTTDVIMDYINNHDTSEMLQGEAYYYNENTEIKSRLFYHWKDGQRIIDTDKINHKIPHGWHKLLVDQKAAYLVGKPVTFRGDDQAYLDKLNEVLNDEMDDILPEMVIDASNKGRDWLHPFINEDGEFDYIQIPAEEVIPIYGGPGGKTLEYIIRYYSLDEDTVKVEVWDRQTVTYYEKTGHGQLVIDVNEEINPAPHFRYGDQGYGWGEVPFIEFKNNKKAVPDIKFYKELVDSYDRIVSDVDNNLEEIQALIYVLKGYEGQGLSEFMENLKKYKAISVEAEAGSGVDTIQAEVPINTVEARLNRVEEDIIKFGQGVDNSPDKFGNNPTGIALKNLYSLLDMKANVLERKFTKGLMWLVWFATEYINMTNNTSYDYKKIEIVFNKSMLTNEAEKITMGKDSAGLVSKQTIVANHPWVTDPEEELQQMKQEQEEQQAAYPLPAVGGNNEGSE